MGETLNVTHGGEAFVIDPKRWAIVYHGPIDQRFAAKPSRTARRPLLRDALFALVAGQPVAFASYDAGGAPIEGLYGQIAAARSELAARGHADDEAAMVPAQHRDD